MYSPDNLIRPKQQRLRDRQAECLGGLLLGIKAGENR
jgi:hypothetical protein